MRSNKSWTSRAYTRCKQSSKPKSVLSPQRKTFNSDNITSTSGLLGFFFFFAKIENFGEPKIVLGPVGSEILTRLSKQNNLLFKHNFKEGPHPFKQSGAPYTVVLTAAPQNKAQSLYPTCDRVWPDSLSSEVMSTHLGIECLLLHMSPVSKGIFS